MPPRRTTKCMFCDEQHTNRTLSKHLLNKHSTKLFTEKNKEKLKRYSESGFKGNPFEFEIENDEPLFFVCCCNTFYTTKTNAKNHLTKNEECRNKVIDSAKQFYSENKDVINITVNGDHNTVINQHINLNIDCSGNKTIPAEVINLIRNLVIDLNCLERERAEAYKKVIKLKTQIVGDIDSEVSDIESYYSDDESSTDDEDKYVKRYDVSKNQKNFLKKNKIDTDLSNDALNLPSYKKKLERMKREQEEKEAEKEFENEVVENEKAEHIENLKSSIDSVKSGIKFWTSKVGDLEKLIKVKDSGMTQKDVDEHTYTKKLHKLKVELIELTKELNKLTK